MPAGKRQRASQMSQGLAALNASAYWPLGRILSQASCYDGVVQAWPALRRLHYMLAYATGLASIQALTHTIDGREKVHFFDCWKEDFTRDKKPAGRAQA